MLDLKTVANEAKNDDNVAELVLLDRDFKAYPDPKPTLQIVGEYSQAYRKNDRALIDKAQADARNGQPWDAERWKAGRIAAGVVGWSNIVVEGQPAKYSLEGVVELFLAAPWTAKQAERAINGHADFFASSSPA